MKHACQECNQTFRSQIKHHVRGVHKSPALVCIICDKTFAKNERNFARRHAEDHLSRNEAIEGNILLSHLQNFMKMKMKHTLASQRIMVIMLVRMVMAFLMPTI
jgi:hypothetical protein